MPEILPFDQPLLSISLDEPRVHLSNRLPAAFVSDPRVSKGSSPMPATRPSGVLQAPSAPRSPRNCGKVPSRTSTSAPSNIRSRLFRRLANFPDGNLTNFTTLASAVVIDPSRRAALLVNREIATILHSSYFRLQEEHDYRVRLPAALQVRKSSARK